MKDDPRNYELVSPDSLREAAVLLSDDPGRWVPIAGGTDLMVLYSAGKLTVRNLLNIWGLSELRQFEVTPSVLRIGAGCTYSDLQKHEIVGKEFSMLAKAASWTGGIANQNRGTLGGNIANASPAADSLPALLAYDAVLELYSVRGVRQIPYSEFHLGYKKHALAPDELIRTICLPRNTKGTISYCRKVGTRNAQAISKVCIAGLARIANGVIEEARIGMGSVAPVPVRLQKTEQELLGRNVGPELVEKARRSVGQQIQPIEDIRSTAQYRDAVATNLVEEFVQRLCVEAEQQ
ncbi:MAG TPA: xanthine dehydrogenase family protein subunit M [Candidatus Acidoferrum sp.]|nr:xanthine dehydrogenase family protein subunit M [Candidatus Acidoferrum sp.]